MDSESAYQSNRDVARAMEVVEASVGHNTEFTRSLSRAQNHVSNTIKSVKNQPPKIQEYTYFDYGVD